MARALATAFERSRGRTGLIPFLTAGYPSLEVSLELMRGFAGAGALAIELGIPFSDPIADGAEIQRASEWALREGVGVSEVLALTRRFREGSAVPVVLMTYFNPVLRHGVERFTTEARAAGADGVLLTDLPPDEEPETWERFDRAGLDTIVLVAPTTRVERLPALLARARGFVYCLARTGVTGRGGGETGSLAGRIAGIRAHTEAPVAVGFGISDAESARALRGVADAVVVGAAFMRAVAPGPGGGSPARARGLAEEILGALA